MQRDKELVEKGNAERQRTGGKRKCREVRNWWQKEMQRGQELVAKGNAQRQLNRWALTQFITFRCSINSSNRAQHASDVKLSSIRTVGPWLVTNRTHSFMFAMSPEISPVTPEISPVTPEISPVTPEISPVTPEISPVSQTTTKSRTQHHQFRPSSRFLTFSNMAHQSPSGPALLITGASPSHSDTPHSVGLLWTSDQAVAKPST